MGESSTRLLSPSSMLRPRERKRERTIASTWDNSRDKFQGKDKIPNFRFRRDKRELKYINKREGRVVFPTERTKLPREILSFSSRIVRSIPSSRERERGRKWWKWCFLVVISLSLINVVYVVVYKSMQVIEKISSMEDSSGIRDVSYSRRIFRFKDTRTGSRLWNVIGIHRPKTNARWRGE